MGGMPKLNPVSGAADAVVLGVRPKLSPEAAVAGVKLGTARAAATCKLYFIIINMYMDSGEGKKLHKIKNHHLFWNYKALLNTDLNYYSPKESPHH